VILYCATTNQGKLREFRASGLPIEPLAGLAGIPAPEETGDTFEANAMQKALYYGAFTPEYLMAEDSGLEVDALGGAPGIYSARYSGEGATDASNNRFLLEKLRGIDDRQARFVCSIALVQGREVIATFRGEVGGEIAREPRGENGFGYDPLFFYAPFGCTFGECDFDSKLRVSHRTAALARLSETWNAIVKA
jgi:XTP/dITP diphosphohydrolase